MIPIGVLPGLRDSSEGYVDGLVKERLANIHAFPDEATSILLEPRATILDLATFGSCICGPLTTRGEESIL